MDVEQFWDLVKKSKRGAEDCEEQAEHLIERLAMLEPQNIVDFDRHMRQRLAESYRWDVWAVAYIINGGCSDDGFDYFRGWLVAQGRDFFEHVLRVPEHAAKNVKDEEVECEAILYAASDAYLAKTGNELPPSNVEQPEEPIGQKWAEEDLEKLYPKLCKRFW
jgi:hypothetical protein